MLTDAFVQQMLGHMDQIRLVSRAEAGEWLLARDLGEVTLGELYEACNLRIPIDETYLPCRDDTLGQTVARLIDDLRLPLRDLLRQPVASVYHNMDTESQET